MWQPLRSHRFMLSFTIIALALLLTSASRAAAHDEGKEGNSAITLRAPLDAADCAATPPTITVLGLTIDVSTATFGAGHGDGGENEDDQGDDDQGDNDQGDDGEHDGGNVPPSCADLVVGQPVVVTFASDAAPLVATSVKQSGEGEDDGEHDGGVEIKAPLQAVDSTLLTVTVLGLTIDASTATIEGNDGEGDTLPADLTQAMPGEFADVHLDATQLPTLVATHIEIRMDSLVVVQAPLDATDCGATPPTITVLGLTIDVSTATIDAGGEGDDGDDGENDDAPSSGCAALVPGSLVRVVLASDAAPLAATLVKQVGEDDEGAEIRAPIQAADSGAMTVTLLGLAIDVSTAGLDGGAPPVDFTKVVVGQMAEAHLDATKLPSLVATTLVVTDVGSDIDVEVDDASGTEIDDADDDVDITVAVKQAVTVQKGARRIKKTSVVQFHTTGHGSFHLSGLPAGAAKISVSRVQAGVTMAQSRNARLKVNKTQKLRLRLKHVH